MIIVGLILVPIAIGFACWLLFMLAVYALPLFTGVSAGIFAYHHSAGIAGAFLVALVTGATTLAVGQIAFARVRAPLLRAAITFIFAAPAAIAGYHASFGLAHIAVASDGWCVALAVVGALLVGATAFARLAALAPPVRERARMG